MYAPTSVRAGMIPCGRRCPAAAAAVRVLLTETRRHGISGDWLAAFHTALKTRVGRGHAIADYLGGKREDRALGREFLPTFR